MELGDVCCKRYSLDPKWSPMISVAQCSMWLGETVCVVGGERHGMGSMKVKWYGDGNMEGGNEVVR